MLVFRLCKQPPAVHAAVGLSLHLAAGSGVGGREAERGPKTQTSAGKQASSQGPSKLGAFSVACSTAQHSMLRRATQRSTCTRSAPDIHRTVCHILPAVAALRHVHPQLLLLPLLVLPLLPILGATGRLSRQQGPGGRHAVPAGAQMSESVCPPQLLPFIALQAGLKSNK